MRRRAGAIIVLIGFGFVSAQGVAGAALEAFPVARSPGATAAQDQPTVPEPELYDDTVLHEISIVFEDDDWQRRLERMNPANPEDLAASLTVDGTTLDRVGVRYKGNTSQRVQSDKKPFNIKTQSFVDGQRLWGYDVINLNNAASDPSMLREALAYAIVRPFMPVPQTAYARVTAQGQYLGVYLMVEQINKEMIDAWFRSDNGIVIKGDPESGARLETSALRFIGESLSEYEKYYEVKTEGRETEGYEHLRELTRILDATARDGGLADDQFEYGVRDVLDVEHALWYLAGSNMIQNGDSYYAGHNFYLYETPNEARFHMLLWDLNMSFGVFPLSGMAPPGRPGGPVQQPDTADLAIESPFVGYNRQSRPLIRRLLGTPTYRADYIAHYRALRDEAFEPQRVEQMAVTYQDLIREGASVEPDPIFTFALFEKNLRQDVTIPSTRGADRFTPGVLHLAAERHEHLMVHPDLVSPDVQLASHELSPQAPTAADDVELRATFEGVDGVTAAVIRYRVDGGAEHVVAMSRSGGADWRGTVPAQREGREVSYVFRGELADGRAVFFPTRTLTEPFVYEVAGAQLPRGETGDLVINELMADNETTIADDADEFDDWLELYNRGSDPVSLAGYFLSDDPADPFAFELPDVELNPGEYLIVWCDNDEEQGPLHAPFGLSRGGESAVLATADEIVDQVDFGEQLPDISYARILDGGEPWQLCNTPSPASANSCGATTPTSTVPPTTVTPGTPGTPATPSDTPSPTPTAATSTAEPGAWTIFIPHTSRP